MKYRKLFLILGFVVSLIFTIVMLKRMFGGYDKFRQRTPGEIAAWMSIPQVARNFDMPPRDLADLLQIPADQRDRSKRITVGDLAKSRGQTVEALSTEIRSLIGEYKKTHSPNPTPPPDVPKETP